MHAHVPADVEGCALLESASTYKLQAGMYKAGKGPDMRVHPVQHVAKHDAGHGKARAAS